MIIPDINLLVYAYDAKSPFHRESRSWWQDVLNSSLEVGIPWLVSLGFTRLVSNPKINANPLSCKEAWTIVESWFVSDLTAAIEPGSSHLQICAKLFHESKAGSNLVTDVHLAALAIEHKATLYSNDTDFKRFKGLDFINPLD